MALKIRDFLAQVQALAFQRLGEDAASYRWRVQFSYLQLDRGDRAVHYEVWVQRKTGRLEFGLHFEDKERDVNYRWAEALGARLIEIKSQLGPEVEVEEWTPVWTRLHYTLPLGPLTDEAAVDAAERLVRLIEVTQPILAQEAAGVRG